MQRLLSIACLLLGTIVVPASAAAQDCDDRSNRALPKEPPGRDLFVPYTAMPAGAHSEELRNREQLRVLAEINQLTVELVKRRSNPYAVQADLPRLVKRLKQLAKELQEFR